MKRILAILILAALVLPMGGQQYMQNRRKAFQSSAPARIYILKENFEADPGYDVTSPAWVEIIATDGTVDEDYTATVLDGTQSLLLTEATGGNVSCTWSNAVDIEPAYGFCMVQVKTRGANGTSRIIAVFANNAGSTLGGLAFTYADSGASIYPVAKIANTGGTNSIDHVHVGDTIYVWFKVSNADNTCEVWWNTTPTKSATYGARYSYATSAITTSARKFMCIEDFAGDSVILDKLRWDSIDIGDSPE